MQENSTQPKRTLTSVRDLYSLLVMKYGYEWAVHHVQQNKGSETAGIDRKNMSHFRGNFDGYIEELKPHSKAETLTMSCAKGVHPKPHSEKKRPLGIPILV